MSANDKVAATFGREWAESPHPDDPRSELGNDGLTDEERAAGLAPMFEPPVIIDTSEPTPEQALRAHVADLLTDVDHFNGCDDDPCTCLVGRLRWAITAEQVEQDQTAAAIDTMARHLIGIQLYAADFGADMWEHIPEVGARDFETITKRIKEIADTAAPAEYDDAYDHLRSRVDGAA